MTAKIVKYPRRKNLTRKLIIAVIIICILVSFCLLIRQTIRYLHVKADIQALESEIEMMKSENEHLEKEIILLQDKEYLEIKARKHLGMVRPGEIIFFVGD
ncbi:MAG: septum formation initiator family protein [Firmicutes bacterium]|nr:septum formation initiator family protein [Bacillota bacterium]